MKTVYIQRFRGLCEQVMRLNGRGELLPYAKSYASPEAINGLLTQAEIYCQILYILNNLRGKDTIFLRKGFKALQKEIKDEM